MAVLLIQHKITDLDVWLETYAKYASEREQAGVKEAHILQPDDDPQYIVVIHFFDTTDAAEEFRTFLRERGVDIGRGDPRNGQRAAGHDPARGEHRRVASEASSADAESDARSS